MHTKIIGSTFLHTSKDNLTIWLLTFHLLHSWGCLRTDKRRHLTENLQHSPWTTYTVGACDQRTDRLLINSIVPHPWCSSGWRHTRRSEKTHGRVSDYACGKGIRQRRRGGSKGWAWGSERGERVHGVTLLPSDGNIHWCLCMHRHSYFNLFPFRIERANNKKRWKMNSRGGQGYLTYPPFNPALAHFIKCT